MNEEECWIYLDGPMPEHVKWLLEGLRGDLQPHTPADQARVSNRFFATLSARTGRGVPVTMGETPKPPARPASVAARDPLADARRAATAPAEAVLSDVAPLSSAPPVDVPSGEQPAGSSVSTLEKQLGIPIPPAPPPGAADTADISAAVKAALGEKWPFGPVPPPPASPPAPVRPAAKTMQTPVVPSPIGRETADLAGTLEKLVGVIPFGGSTSGSGVVPYPNLPIVEYCKFCAQLAASPAQVTEIRTRYGVVSAASHAALDAHWRQYFINNPEDGVKIRDYVAHYAAWLRTLQR